MKRIITITSYEQVGSLGLAGPVYDIHGDDGDVYRAAQAAGVFGIGNPGMREGSPVMLRWEREELVSIRPTAFARHEGGDVYTVAAKGQTRTLPGGLDAAEKTAGEALTGNPALVLVTEADGPEPWRFQEDSPAHEYVFTPGDRDAGPYSISPGTVAGALASLGVPGQAAEGTAGR